MKLDIKKIKREIRLSTDRAKLESLKSEINLEILLLKEERNKILNDINSLDEKQYRHLTKIEFNSQSYAAFYNTRLEQDKSILTMSIAGLGFTISQLKKDAGTAVIFMSILSSLLFLLSAIIIVRIFRKNATHLEHMLNDHEIDAEHSEKSLAFRDRVVQVFFSLALALSFLIGVLKVI